MSYLALARKWRPKTFSQLLGQEHVNKPLVNALTQQRIHHAYLFTGTRGVGKTSVARILAKALNCEIGITAEPCLSCDACISIDNGRFIDLIEIDGASKTKVEDIRELLDNVPYAPTNGRFKVYLIDEVHMLSSHSFNALLKTLEEPPAHVKFILATTDPQKVPITVLSRCLQFHLKHLTPEVICQQLQQILSFEAVDYEINALQILAQAAQGSMRDALTLLDQAITTDGNKLEESAVKLLLGYTQKDYALQLLQALLENNASLLIQINQKINFEGGHFQYVLNQLLTHLHQIAIYQTIGDTNTLISPNNDIIRLATHLSPEDVQLFYQIALRATEDMHLAPSLAIGFSMTLLRMLTFRPATKVAAPPLTVQKDLTVSKDLNTYTPAYTTSEPCKQSSSESSLDIDKIQSNDTANSTLWSDLIPKLKLSGLALNALENAEFISKEECEVTLALEKGHQSLFTPTTVEKIQQALRHYYNSPIKLVLVTEKITTASPAQQKTKAIEQKQKNAENSLQNDPNVLKIQQEFAAELVKNSIVPLKNTL